MPLDGHTYLASYGWSGKGTGLRSGAIDKPLAIPPKRNLTGIGKDRDEAFPFWDHLYSAATKAITIKIVDDDEEEDEDENENENKDTSAALQLKRTATGIISNKRPILGTPASGTSTPDLDTYTCASVITVAKREAARKGLYSRFFRGPVLAPDGTTNSTSSTSSPVHSADDTGEQGIPQFAVTSTKESTKRTSSQILETREERRERKRLKRERREKKASRTTHQKTSLHDPLPKKLADNAELQKEDFATSRIVDVPQFDNPNDVETKKRKKRKRKDS